MTIQPGEFWVADIPFTSGGASKKRPVLVLWLDALDAVVAAVTSAAPRSSTDVLLADWTSAGLRVPSTVRLSRLDSLEQARLIHKIGAISTPDAHQVKLVWSTHVKPAF
jgi:mRNA interferase MazF